MKAGSDPNESATTAESGWFHCAKCGGLFESPLGSHHAPTCSHCGQAAGDPHEAAQSTRRVHRKKGRSSRARQPQTTTAPAGKKRVHVALILSGVWFGLLGFLVFTVRTCFPDQITKPEANAAAEYYRSLEAEDNQLLNSSMGECQARLRSFLTESTASSRGEYLAHGLELTGRISQYESSRPVLRSDDVPELIQAQALHTTLGTRISSYWKIGGDRTIEAVFLKEGESWKLDWPALVQESTMPWTLFVTGAGDSTGTFRVFARKREGTTGREIELVLYTPILGYPDQFGEPTTPIRLSANTKMGETILKAFERRSKGQGAFNSVAVKFDPADMIRLRVRLSRTIQGDEKLFQIDEVLADHWMEPWGSDKK
jgi:hypothetical protein